MMGSNYAAAGFANVEAFVQAMCDREAAHLRAFIGYCRENDLVDALRDHDWTAFAEVYNGSGQVAHYAAALKAAYDRHAAHAAAAPGDSVLHLLDRGPAVRKLQELLRAAGNSIEPDGVFGQQTEAAVRQFQSDHGLAADGVVGSRTWAVLRS